MQMKNEYRVACFLVPVHVYRLALWAKFSADGILHFEIFVLFFPEKRMTF